VETTSNLQQDMIDRIRAIANNAETVEKKGYVRVSTGKSTLAFVTNVTKKGTTTIHVPAATSGYDQVKVEKSSEFTKTVKPLIAARIEAIKATESKTRTPQKTRPSQTRKPSERALREVAEDEAAGKSPLAEIAAGGIES
jgi:hypothetical protein